MTKIIKYSFFLLLFLTPALSFSQSVNAPLNRDYEHLIERYEIKTGKFSENIHSHVKPYLRKNIVELTDSVANNNNFLTERDKFNLTYLRNDSWEWAGDSAQNDSRKPILKTFYKKKSDFYNFQNEDFDVHVNPVMYFGYGSETNSNVRTYINTRGLELRGMIDKRIGFYTFLTENQITFPTYVRDRISSDLAVPNENYYRKLGDDPSSKTSDFITARGYITFKVTKHIDVQFGHDKNFIGNGYRSMILSDYSGNYLFLKLSAQVWKIKYTNIFAQMTASDQSPLLKNYPKKFFTFHHLSVNIGKKLNIGLFESIITGAPDSLGGSHLNAENLNPIIFYRAIELNTGSNGGNALLGLDFKYNFARHFSLYGQVVLDEFRLSEVKSGKGWWGNKQAGQIGLKYIDAFGLRNFDLQGEVNIARPFTYSHETSFTNYTHYNQPLAHPMGANFNEFVGIARYQALKRLNIIGKLVVNQFGADSSKTSSSNGGDVLKSYNKRNREYGYKIGSGIKTTLIYMDLTVSYQIKHNMFIDLKQIIRNVHSDLPSLTQSTSISSISFRWNIAPREQVF